MPLSQQQKEELKKEYIEEVKNDLSILPGLPVQPDTSILLSNLDICSDYWLSKFDQLIQEKVEKIEKGFADFNLQDWSGEGEVYDEIDRLKQEIITILKE